MRKRRGSNTTIISLLLILIFFGIRMMLPNNVVLDSDVINREDFQLALVTKVVDGDTIWVEINGELDKVRFIGVDTPEKGEVGFSEASEYTSTMLLDQLIFLEKDVSNTDKYGRLLRYVWFDIPVDISDQEKKLKLFNSKLLESGFANIAEYKPDVKYLKYFRRLVGQE